MILGPMSKTAFQKRGVSPSGVIIKLSQCQFVDYIITITTL